MASSSPYLPLLLSLSLLLLVRSCLCVITPNPVLTYNGGPILTGNVNLAIIWYGQVGRVQKNAIRAFIKSLNYNAAANLQPQVSSWWKVIEGYQEAAGKEQAPIYVKVVKQVSETSYSIGKVMTADFLSPLIQKASDGNPNTIPVIITARDVTVQGLCMGKCSTHGLLDNKPYIMLGNPETECPGACAWPFHKADVGPQGVILNPPNGNMAADAMIVALAQALAETVTNPLLTGFYQEHIKGNIEAGYACQGIFGTGAVEGYTGKVLVDPADGGGFNAYGSRGRKFLVPAVWDPKTKTCWTMM